MIATLKIFELARTTGVKKVIFASTSSIYGDNTPPLSETQAVTPPNIYSVTKHNMEEMAYVYSDLYDLEIIAFRFMSIYGLNEEHKGKFANLVSQFLWTIYQGKQPVIFGEGNQTRDFTNAIDVARGIKLAIETEKKYGFTVFNIGSSVEYPVRDLIGKINAVLGTNIEARYIPNPLRWTATSQYGDLTKIERELGYKPSIDLDTGLKMLVDRLPSDPTQLPDVSDIENTLKK
jgi:UDP-glucose 4-epimerase